MKRITKNQLEYKKQVKRIQQGIRRLMKRGYRFNDSDEIPKIQTIIGEKPKRITKQYLDKLKNIKPKDLAKEATYYGVSGNKFTGEQGLEIEKEIRREKRKNRNSIPQNNEEENNTEPETINQGNIYPQEDFAQQTIQNFLTEYVYLGEDVYRLLYDWLDFLIQQNGLTAVSQMLLDGAYNGVLVQGMQPYHLDDGITYISNMLNYLDVDDSIKQDIMDIMNSRADEIYSFANAEGRTVFR